jgi:DNA-binding response OmpR family regulator
MDATHATTRRPDLLLVEDDDEIGELLTLNLREHGYDARRVRDGQAALLAIRQRAPDALVLDLGLPRLDGLRVLASLRADGHAFPVLILSARTATADRLEGFRLGADDYVTKPFHTLELVARLRVLLRRAAAGEAAASVPDDVIGFSDEELTTRYGLTARQATIARLMARGHTNLEIAERLAISRFTARNHANQVLERLGVPSRRHVAPVLRAAYDAARAPRAPREDP